MLLTEQAAWVLGSGCHREGPCRQGSGIPQKEPALEPTPHPPGGPQRPVTSYSVGLLFSVERPGEMIPTLEKC